MTMTPEEIEDALKNIPEDEESRIQVLKQVTGVATELKVTSPRSLESLAEKVGIASREELWRIPLGKSGLLDFFLELFLLDDLTPSLANGSLRVIGNSCADQDENRRLVIDSGHLPRLVQMVERDPVAVPVLFNVCVDYEPAQVAAYKAELAKYLAKALDTETPYKGIVYKLLILIATQEYDPLLIHPSTPARLLSLASQEASKSHPPDLEAFMGLCTAGLSWLSHDRAQEELLSTPGSAEVVLEAFRIATEASSIFEVDDAEDQAQLAQLHSTFTQFLADLSARPGFYSSYPPSALPDSAVDSLISWVSSGHVPLQTAACLVLGNIARSDELSTLLVQEKSVHEPLVAILSSHESPTTDAQLLHSVLSFLKNLSIPAGNKPVLGDAGILNPDILPRICDFDVQPQVQFDAVSLTRLLLVNCPNNVRRVCVPSAGQDTTPLQQLIDLHYKADQEPIKMETARAVGNVCRVLHTESPVGSSLLPLTSASAPASAPSSAPEETQTPLLQDFYDKHPKLADTLLYLGLQAKFPTLRSELWFVLALMARSADGAAIVAQWMRQHPQVVDVLAEAITGTGETGAAGNADSNGNGNSSSSSSPPPSEEPAPDLAMLSGLGQLQLEPRQADPGQAATMARVDRENALVLVSELLRRCPDELAPAARGTLSRVLRRGGEMILGNRGVEREGTRRD
ncbi:ARM repeat-containing protein [Hypoxylon sp. NC1633]|nr:ARM repeat-containing protein [Hypoxylon sp. NC1633]